MVRGLRPLRPGGKDPMLKCRGVRFAVALLCVSVLAGGLELAGEPRQAAAAVKARNVSSPVIEAGKAGASAADVPGLASPAVRASGPVVPTGDFSNPPSPGGPPPGWKSPAPGFDQATSTEMADKTSDTTRLFRNVDGSFTQEVSAQPVRFRDAKGQWRPIDTSLVTGPGGRLVRAGADATVSVAGSSGPGDLVEVDTTAGQVGFRQPGLVAVSPKVTGSAAVYSGAVGRGTDVKIGALANGFEASTVLSSYVKGAGTTVEEFVIPDGVKARAGGPGVELVAADGQVVGSYGSGMAVDSVAGIPGTAEVVTSLVGQVGNVVTVRVSVDEGWLASPQRVFPLTIDPVFVTGSDATGAADTYVSSTSSTSQINATGLVLGSNATNALVVGRALLRFNVSSIVGSNRQVTEAHMNANWMYAPSCTGRPVEVRGLQAAFGPSTVWANQPAMGPVAATSPSFAKGGGSSCPAGVMALDMTGLAQSWVNGDPNNGLMLKAVTEGDTLAGKWLSSAESATVPVLSVTYNRPPTAAQLSSPAAGSEAITTQPTFAVTGGSDPDGDPLSYWYSVSTDPTGTSGQVLASGWLTSTSWTPPAGALLDGSIYYWTVYTSDGIAWPPTPPTARALTVNLRLGAGGNWQTDSVGPAKVNLTNGNLIVNTSSPTFSTVGGDMGLSYAYNSRASSTFGLTGSYYDLSAAAAGSRPSGSDQPTIVRRDPVLNFNWGTGSPWGQIAPDKFYVKWSGFLTVPTTGTYNFGGFCDDGETVTISATTVFDGWSGGCASSGSWSSSVSLTAGTSVPIAIEYYEGAGSASIELMAKGPGLASSGVDVPSSWLSTTAPTLPTGWGVSADLDGSITYRSALFSGNAISFIQTDGTVDRYVWDAVKQYWQPPAGSHGVVNKAPSGEITLLDDDGKTYVFSTSGTLTSVTSAIDDAHPAALGMTWTGSPSKLTTETDPVSGRSITLHYAGDSVCTSASGFSAAPAGMLCAIDYSDFASGTTQLRYNSNGQLARIDDPGAEVTDFAYDANGRVAKIRDPLAADAVAAGVRTDGDAISTLVSYTSGSGKVASIQQPEPLAGEARPGHTYSYVYSNTTDVFATGLTSTTGKLEEVIFDSIGETTSDTDQAGRTTHNAWDTNQHKTATWDDATGLATTTVFDAQGNQTDTWGPAPSSRWTSISAGGAPTTTVDQAATPHSTDRYDEGITTLAATWWNNATFAGPPAAHQTGIGASDGEVVPVVVEVEVAVPRSMPAGW